MLKKSPSIGRNDQLRRQIYLGYVIEEEEKFVMVQGDKEALHFDGFCPENI
jgi:hypothetical protein